MPRPDLQLLDFMAKLKDPPEADPRVRDKAIRVAVDLLRLGLGPRTRRELLQPFQRSVWVEASRLLAHERSQRDALAHSHPGQRLEDVLGYNATLEQPLGTYLASRDTEADAIRARLGL